jgi:hypothetical protein
MARVFQEVSSNSYSIAGILVEYTDNFNKSGSIKLDQSFLRDVHCNLL